MEASIGGGGGEEKVVGMSEGFDDEVEDEKEVKEDEI